MAGSIGNAVGNDIYTDLVLTRYPKSFDERSGAKANANFKRWTNLKDYNMAEHVNSLQDAVMSLQRLLGEMAQMPAKPTNSAGKPITNPTELNALAKTNTVKKRLDDLETKDWYSIFDKRYGGPTWKFTEGATQNPTIQQHQHLGSASGIPGMPEKINLTKEVQKKLPKANMDLSKNATGLTGADVYVDRNSPQKISQSLNDKISETTGGKVQRSATLTVDGKMNTRWTREFDSTDASLAGNTIVSDPNTLTRQSVLSGPTAQSNLLYQQITGMHYGRYVAIVRLASNSLQNANVVAIEALDSKDKVIGSTTLKGSDFGAANTYKNFYVIFEHLRVTKLRVRKLATKTTANIRMDYAIIEPVHPAVFDR